MSDVLRATSEQSLASSAAAIGEVSPADAPDWLVAATLCRREMVRFLRQPNRVFGAVGQPLVFWILFGAGLGPSFRMPGAEGSTAVAYRDYFFPGTLVLVVLFTAIFTSISVIEDRREGFLQSVLVAPITRRAMVLGKLLGGALIALFEGVLFLGLGCLWGLRPGVGAVVHSVALLFVLSLALTALGFVLSWRMNSTQGFHAVMSVFLMPMWLLSGAFFPAERGWLAWIQRVNPLSYGVAGLRRLLYAEVPGAIPAGTPSLVVAWSVLGLVTVVLFAWAVRISRTRTTGDLL